MYVGHARARRTTRLRKLAVIRPHISPVKALNTIAIDSSLCARHGLWAGL